MSRNEGKRKRELQRMKKEDREGRQKIIIERGEWELRY